MAKIFPRTVFPRKATNFNQTQLEDISETVLIMDEDDLLGLASYSYNDEHWIFLTDTLQDMTNVDFVWCYPPDELLYYYNNNKNK